MSIRHESLSEAAKMTEVIASDACSRLPFETSVAPADAVSLAEPTHVGVRHLRALDASTSDFVLSARHR